MMYVFLLGAVIAVAVVAVVWIRTRAAITLRHLELSMQLRQYELNQRFLAGELNPAPVVLGPTLDAIRSTVRAELVDHDAGDDWIVEWKRHRQHGFSKR